MAGKIFYRVRQQSDCGDNQPRFQWVAHSGVPLDLCGKHLRLKEFELIAEAIGAELLRLPEKTVQDEKI